MNKSYFILWKSSLKDWRFYVKFLIGITQIVSNILFFTVLGLKEGISVVFQNLAFFTVQSNFLSGFFFLASAFHHHREGEGRFDNSEVGKIVILYLTLTVFIYNLNEMMATNPYQFWSWEYTMSFICKHSVVPIFAIIYVLFFYNHKNAKPLKTFSSSWLWWMVIGLFTYMIFFSLIGEIAWVSGWKPLFETSKNQSTTFVYPFLDWHNGVGFFKKMVPWLECSLMCSLILLVSIGIDYLYTIIVLRIKSCNYQIKIQNQVVNQQV